MSSSAFVTFTCENENLNKKIIDKTTDKILLRVHATSQTVAVLQRNGVVPY